MGTARAHLKDIHMDTGNRGVNDPLNARGAAFTAPGGVVHATVPLPSQPEPLSGAAENAAHQSRAANAQVVTAQAHSRTTDAATPISRQLLGDGVRRRRRGLRRCGGCGPLLDPLGRRTDEARQGREMVVQEQQDMRFDTCGSPR